MLTYSVLTDCALWQVAQAREDIAGSSGKSIDELSLRRLVLSLRARVSSLEDRLAESVGSQLQAESRVRNVLLCVLSVTYLSGRQRDCKS